MKKLKLFLASDEQRIKLGLPDIRQFIIDNMTASYNTQYIQIALATPIVDGAVTAARPPSKCREVAIAKVKDVILARVEVLRELLKIMDLDHRVGFMFLLKCPYPNNTTMRNKVKTFRSQLEKNISKALPVFHRLEKRGKWTPTEIYSLDCNTVLKGGHAIGFLVEGDAMWVDNPALASLFLMISRLMLRCGKEFTKSDLGAYSRLHSKVSALHQYILGRPYHAENKKEFEYAKSDLGYTAATVKSWARFIGNYDKIRTDYKGKIRRRKSFYTPFTFTTILTDGIHALHCLSHGDRCLVSKYREHAR